MSASTEPASLLRRGTDLLPLFPEQTWVTPDGELVIGGVRVTELAERFGTPAYIVDETGLRLQAERMKKGLAERWPDSDVLFASKSFPCVAAYKVLGGAGPGSARLGVDVAGAGEMVMALAAGVPPERIYQHGSAKSTEELAMAVQAGIAMVVVDNFDDIDRLEQLTAATSRQQPVLVRITPGISPDTHESQSTGGADAKFGLPPDQAREAFARIRASSGLRLDGVHVHIGSQILQAEPFGQAVEAIARLGTFDVYDVGGGLGVRYTLADDAPSLKEYLDTIAAAAEAHLPAGARLLIEPGRSLVARSCVTLYQATTVKHTGRTFLAVNGGMADNLDAALTGQPFEAVLATRMNEPCTETVDLVGRQCESGDRLVAGLAVPAPAVGDLVAMPVTGAYTYTLANNYNGALRPPIVFCRDGQARLAAERETHDHVLALHRPALDAGW